MKKITELHGVALKAKVIKGTSVFFLLSGSTLLCAAPRQDFTMSASVEGDSNPQMVESDEEAIWRGVLIPDYRLTWTEDNDEVIAQARVRVEQSSDTDISSNREDPLLSLQWINSAPRGEFRLRGAYEEVSTRFSEFDDTGHVFSDTTKTQSSVDAGWDRSLTERLQFSLSGGYADNSYDDGTVCVADEMNPIPSCLTDYTIARASTSLSFQMSEVSTPYIQIFGSNYDPDDTLRDDSQLYGVQTGVNWQLSPVLGLNVNVGVSEVDSSVEKESNVSWGTSLNYEAERLGAELSYARATEGSGLGGYTESDSIRGSLTYALGPLVDIGGSLNWRENRSFLNNETAFVELWADRRLSESWSTRFSWRYKRQELNFASHAHILILSLRYTLPR